MNKKAHLKTVTQQDMPAYVSWDGKIVDSPEVLKHMSGALDSYVSIARDHSKASYYHHDYSDLASNVSGRPGLSRSDYEAFRPQEAIPHSSKGIIAKADHLYQTVGLIRNIIDLMGDFGSQGIRLTHPNKQIQKFYRKWFEKVHGEERSERFLNYLYRVANVVVRRQTAKLTVGDGRKLEKSIAAPDLELERTRVPKGEIPFKYTFLNPLTVDIVGGSLASFIGKPQYTLSLPAGLKRILKNAQSKEYSALFRDIPIEIKQAINTSSPIPLDPVKTRVFHYKKDDWQDWARPMIYAIMVDINIVEKMKLADTAALDGAISNMRIFKLGSLEHKIAPTRAAAAKLAEILESNVGGGTMDLVWGPDIELIESKSDVYKFLGEEKFRPHLNSIYAGLGIPPTLTGTLGAAGTTNNFISLKTILQRLAYGRDRLNEFWTIEIEQVQKAMGFRLPAKVEYDIDNLGDENAEKTLLIQLADRNLISDELLQYRFGHDPDMEKIRLNRENRERDSGSLLPKAGPWHDPQLGTTLKKMALQKGTLTPGQVGLSPKASKRDFKIFESNPQDVKPKDLLLKPVSNPKLSQVPGRPKNSKDKTKRKTKDFKPQVRASISVWVDEAQSTISSIVNPAYLKEVNKKDMRNLTKGEMKEVEDIRFTVLWNLKPLQKVDLEVVKGVISNDIPASVLDDYYNHITNTSKELGRNLTIKERHDIQKQLFLNQVGDI